MTSGPLHEIDAALVRLRRWLAVPDPVIDVDGTAVELSSLLVLEALADGAGTSDGPDAPAGDHGAARREASVADVAAVADVAPSTASRFVERAVAAGLVAREGSPGDRRRRTLSPTPAGAALRARAAAFRRDRLDAALDAWPPADVEHLARLLAAFAATAAASPAPRGSRRTAPRESP